MAITLEGIKSYDVENFVNVLKKESPQSLMVISFLEICHKWRQTNANINISLLNTKESLKNGVFIGILKITEDYPLIAVYAFDSYEKNLEEALDCVQVDWRNTCFFEGVSQKHRLVVENFITKRSSTFTKSDIIVYSMPVETALNLEICCLAEVEFKPLEESHVDEIYEIWVKKDVLPKHHLESCIKYNEPALGLFCTKTGELLSRCLISHFGVISALQTAENAQNKGYGKLLLKRVSQLLAEKNITPVSYVADFNSVSRAIFEKVGYGAVAEMVNYSVLTDNTTCR